MLKPYLLLGEIVRPQGVRGEVKVRHYTDDPARFEELETVYFEKDGQYSPVALLSAREQKGDVFLLLEGVADRDAAEKLRGQKLYVDRAHARELGEDEAFIADMLGMHAENEQGEALGTLKAVVPAGGADVFVLDTPQGELMFPAIGEVVLKLDVENERMVLCQARLSEVSVYADRHTDHLS